MPETVKKPAVKRAPVAHRSPKEHKAPAAAAKSTRKYVEAVGRRKTAIARVRISAGNGKMTVNDKEAKKIFPAAPPRRGRHRAAHELKIAREWDTP